MVRLGRSRLRSAGLLAVLPWLTGCESPQPATRLAEWSFVEDLRFGGGADDPEGLSQLKGLLVATNGTVWALEASTQNIRVFDSTGLLQRTIGRKGQGPGEFLYPDGMASAPNGLVWVHDPQNGRFSIFTESGEFVRQQVAPAGGYGWVWTGGIDRSGRVWDRLIERAPEGSEGRVSRTSPDWSRADTLEIPRCRPPGWQPGEGSFWKPLEGGPEGAARYSIIIPFYPGPVMAFDWVSGAVWCAPRGDRYELVRIGLEAGDTLARITGAVSPVPVTPRERDSVIGEVREFLARMNEPDPDFGRIPAEKPVITSAFVDDAGRLWVRRSGGEPGSRFDLYSPDGEPIATVRIPHPISSWLPPVVRGVVVWLAAQDDDGVPYVVRGRIGP